MRVEPEREYERFLELERARYEQSHVTKGERASFNEEVLLLRAFRISGNIGPNMTYRGD